MEEFESFQGLAMYCVTLSSYMKIIPLKCFELGVFRLSHGSEYI